MSHEKTTLEVIAPSVEEAVNRGLGQLGLPADAVDVEVLDAGSRGLFGLGSRQARVRLSIKSQEPAPVQPERRTAEPPERPAVAESPAPARSSKPEVVAPVVEASDEDRESMRVATEVVSELLDKMKVQAEVKAEMVPPVDENDESLVMVEVRGDDLSILIGRRSETLNALQYIASLIVAKELGRWVPMSIDVQGYRARRERQLRTLARRMAEQAIHTGRKQTLEPMPANERRLVHLELRDHPEVYTESIGDEPNRKVTILLKRPANRN
ncbi:MAG TPA: RNA-binding cell elongation regulator Jag/EloR [Anaerolineaceae bacterium]|nr:RNA-binding cell elongation regulator Jag/EloR [Anaerolineaceae bacterium]